MTMIRSTPYLLKRSSFLMILLYRGLLAEVTRATSYNETMGCYNPNVTIVLMCNIVDISHRASTVWSGTIFNCPNVNSISNNRIYLPHSQFNTRAFGNCNDGIIFAESTGVNGTLYSSTLTISPRILDINDQTITCSLGFTLINTEILRVGSIPQPPPSTSFSFPFPFQVFTVSWTAPLNVSGGVGNFLVNASDGCGQCSDLGMIDTNITEVLCSGWEALGQICNISVYTITADCQLRSAEPAMAAVHLKLPGIPRSTKILPTYSFDTLKSLRYIQVVFFFHQQNIMDENGYSINYVLVYTHSSGSEPVEVLLDCSTNTSCTHTYETDQMGGEYFVQTGAQTPIGKVIQPDNMAHPVETVNTFVNVTVDVLKSYTIINCFFSKYDCLSCYVEYGQDCDNLLLRKERSVSNESDISLLLNDIIPSTVYCFIVTAGNQSHSVKVKGTFRGYVKKSSTLSVSISIVIPVTVIMALAFLIALTASFIICCKRPNPKEKDEARSVYYSKDSAGDTVTADPTYEEISTKTKNAAMIDTSPNEAYHPVSVQPNEAYQLSVSITSS